MGGDPLSRMLGRAAMQRVAPKTDGEPPFDRPNDREFVIPDDVDPDSPEMAQISKKFAEEIERQCFEEMAAVIEKNYPDMVVCGGDIMQRLNELIADQDRIKKLRWKYRWIPVTEALPRDERRVLIFTEYGVYRGYYDHKHKCWRTTRTVRRVTHWRNQDCPEMWV